MLKNHSAIKKDKDLCMEIAQVLTDSFHSNASAQQVDSKLVESSCSCGRSNLSNLLFLSFKILEFQLQSSRY